jgi:hypothetical protein
VIEMEGVEVARRFLVVNNSVFEVLLDWGYRIEPKVIWIVQETEVQDGSFWGSGCKGAGCMPIQELFAGVVLEMVERGVDQVVVF